MSAKNAMEPDCEPDWMSRLPGPLLRVPLWDLAIPGSHDSMSFCLDLSSPMVRSEPLGLRLLDCFLPCCMRPCVRRWSTTQVLHNLTTRTVRSAKARCLVFAEVCAEQPVRFRDSLLGPEDRQETSRGRHAVFCSRVYTLISVKEALEELCVWMDAHPKEVLILFCSHFEQMTEEDHQDLVQFIITLFGPKLCPPQEQPSLNSCWLQGQQLIVSYDDDQMVDEHPQLWTKIPYWYANSPDPKTVIQYLDNKLSMGRPETFFASGLNLTEDIPFVLQHPQLNLRRLTMKGLPSLLRWTNQQRPGPQRGGVTSCALILLVSVSSAQS
ncbi:hypothetical protein WMY93_022673 [Mugilogobius chulae]|uniref:PI-PLC X domain-containing protein 1 n=1 Tax=Mugilogobius chulae TaxID=88201 RepID=A0AAW0N7L8_9GOBI